MILLVTSAHPTLLRYRPEHLGRLVQPRHYSSIEQTAEAGIPWAADNDAFKKFNAAAFNRMLDRLRGLPGCLFVACPDVVGDAEATAQLFRRWAPGIARRGLPIALVAQDGLTPNLVPWFDIAALFLGGTTAWKLGPAAREVALEAKARGKWLHVGRVNSFRRLVWVERLGADSADGSSWAVWRDTWLPAGLRHLANSGEQLEFA